VPTCSDEVHNGDETDADCGGSCPSRCEDGAGCATGDDCLSGVCDATSTCAVATCDDMVQNGDETDVDCGGSCPGCADGEGCAESADCESRVCETASSSCASPTCSDTVQNGDETDVDCGGSCPDGCADGGGCALDSDCQSRVCDTMSASCAVPTCTDTVQNGDETDVDCGGSCPTGCAEGARCLVDSDCVYGACDASTSRCLNSPPVGNADTVETFGNTSTVLVPGQQFSLLQNDTDVDGDTLSAIPTSTTSAQGGDVDVFADGTFEYRPPVGVQGITDSFTYELTDGLNMASATVDVQIHDELIWYVDVGSASAGTGRSDAPFGELASVNALDPASDPDGPGDYVFLYEDASASAPIALSRPGGLVLEDGQVLIGQGAPLVVPDPSTLADPTRGGPETQLTIPVTDNPQLINLYPGGDGVVLSGGDHGIRGITIHDLFGGMGLLGAFQNLLVRDVSITGGGGLVDLQDGYVDAVFDQLSSTSSNPGSALRLSQVDGTFTVSRDTDIASASDAGVEIEGGAVAVRFVGNLTIGATVRAGLSVRFVPTSGSLTVEGSTQITSSGTQGIQIDRSAVAATFSGPVTVTGAALEGIRISDSQASSDVRFDGDVLVDDAATHAIDIAAGAGTVRFTNPVTVSNRNDVAISIRETLTGSLVSFMDTASQDATVSIDNPKAIPENGIEVTGVEGDVVFQTLDVDGGGTSETGVYVAEAKDDAATSDVARPLIRLAGTSNGARDKSGGTISNHSRAGVHIENSYRTELRSLEVRDAPTAVFYRDAEGAHLLQGCDLIDFDIGASFPDRSGVLAGYSDASTGWEEIRLQDCAIAGSSLGSSQTTAVRVAEIGPVNTSATVGTIVLESSTLENHEIGIDAGDEGNGVELHIVVTGTTIRDVSRYALSSEVSGATTRAFVVTDGLNIGSVPLLDSSDVRLVADGSSELSGLLQNVTMDAGSESTGVEVQMGGLVPGDPGLPLLDVTFQGLTMGGSDSGVRVVGDKATQRSTFRLLESALGRFDPLRDPGAGLEIETASTAELDVLVDDTEIHNSGDTATSGDAGQAVDVLTTAESTLNVTVTGAFDGSSPSGSTSPLGGDPEIGREIVSVVTEDTASTCLALSGTTFTTPASAELRLFQADAGSLLEVEDLSTIATENRYPGGGAIAVDNVGAVEAPIEGCRRPVDVMRHVTSPAVTASVGSSLEHRLEIVDARGNPRSGIPSSDFIVTAISNRGAGYIPSPTITETATPGVYAISLECNAVPGPWMLQIELSPASVAGDAKPLRFYVRNTD